MTIEEVKNAFNGRCRKYFPLTELAENIRVAYPIYKNTEAGDLRREMKKVLDKNIDIFAHKPRTQQYSLKPIRPVGPLPAPVKDDKAGNLYVGSAGEMAVQSELLFQGFGVSRPAVDTGIDILAIRNTSIFFVQVKTSCLDETYTAKFTIKKASYDKHAEDFVRYVLVIRCGDGTTRFFTFSQESIDRLARSHDKTYSITIKYDRDSHRPMITTNKTNTDIYDYRGVRI